MTSCCKINLVSSKLQELSVPCQKEKFGFRECIFLNKENKFGGTRTVFFDLSSNNILFDKVGT